jgi:uncharacterized protein
VPIVPVSVTDHPDAHRYEIRTDGELAGFAAYRAQPGRIDFVHTEIDPRFAGHGLASDLIRHALDDARARGLAVLPYCPFVLGFIERHEEYVDLVPEQDRPVFGLAGGTA